MNISKIREYIIRYNRVLIKTSKAIIYFAITYCIPKNKKLWVFGCWKGRNYSDNARELFEYVCKNKPDVKAVWIAKNRHIYNYVKGLGFPVVLYSSLRAKLLVATAAANVQTESNEDTGSFKVGRSKTIQLFHGTGAVKENYAYGGMGVLKKKLVKIYADNHSISYWMVSSDYFKNRFPVLLECNPSRIIVTGQPKVDSILRYRKIEYFENIKSIGDYNKIIAYTPTHRNFAQGSELYVDEASWERFNQFFSENKYLLFFKPHPLELHKYISWFHKFSNIKLVTEDLIPGVTEFNEYMHYFDMLISDYSSISTDFLLFDRPVIHFMYDKDTFDDDKFKLNALDKFLAGPIVKTLDELMSMIIESFVCDAYTDLRKKATQTAFKFVDAKNSERVYNAIVEILNK